MTGFASAQDQPTTRRVDAPGVQVQINQIETSQFPEVVVFATVSKDGAPVPGLTEKDFRVREDEVDQEPLTVAPKLSPLAAVLTIDTSGSMSKRLADAKVAAKNFLAGLQAQDQVQVIRFSRDVKTIYPLGPDRAAAAAAIDSTVARGDTALWDALYASVESLRAVAGRKAIILLSDGVDDDGTGKPLSRHTVEDVLELARQVNVPVYAIGLGTELDEAALQRVTAETGALYLNATEARQLSAMYDSIGRQLAGQYTIHYTSNLPADGTEHRVQLTIASNTHTKSYLPPITALPAPPVATPKPAAPVPSQPGTAPASPAVEATNVALAAQGGHIADFASQYNDRGWAVTNLIDGSSKKGWAGRTNGPQAVVIGFKDGQLAEVTDILINPYTDEGLDNWVTEVEFYASPTYPWKDFTPLGTMRLAPEGTDQLFELPNPVKARYLKVLF
ncbi:MAG: VWA domain-containing protein, partial [Rubrivivax sp.]|nr:VWA domain-containing protein [Rubrivivax sp.]